MKDIALKFVAGYPRTDWLRRTAPNCQIPKTILPRLADIHRAAALLKGASLHPQTDLNEQTATAFIITFSPPPGFEKQEGASLLVSKAAVTDIPLGSALFKFRVKVTERTVEELLMKKEKGEAILEEEWLLPAERAEKIFKFYSRMLGEIIGHLGARPFACLTGNEVDQPAYDLQERSFKFFFSSSVPDLLYGTIGGILQTNRDLIMLPIRLKQMILDGEITHVDGRQIANRRVELQTSLRQLKSVQMGKDFVRHSILEEVILEISNTTLIDLR